MQRAREFVLRRNGVRNGSSIWRLAERQADGAVIDLSSKEWDGLAKFLTRPEAINEQARIERETFTIDGWCYIEECGYLHLEAAIPYAFDTYTAQEIQFFTLVTEE